MADTKQLEARTGLFRNFRDNTDGTFAEEHSGQTRAWDATSLSWVKVLVDHASGALSTTGGGGAGGGAVTMADGANVTQGTTTDLSSASTVIGILKAIKAAITGTLAVSGTFWQATQPVSGTFWQATQPVSLASAPSTPVTGTFWQATQPVSGTFFQATQPISGTVTANDVPPTLTKGTQGSTGFSVQDLKDSGRVNIAWTAEFAFAQTAETLLVITESRDGAASTTASSKVVTTGKRLRITSVQIEVEGLGSGTAPQRAYLRMRFNTAGATTTSSPLQGVWGCVNNPAVVKTGTSFAADFPDGIEFLGDGTKTIGFSLETPDWVTSTGTGRAKITITAFEY